MKIGICLLAIIFCLSAFSCGRSGDSNSDDGHAPSDGGTIDDNPKKVTGNFYFENTDTPATGIELLLADWSSLTIKPFTVRSDGSVSIELSEFSEGRIYSFHLISGDRKIADLDLSTVNSGLQSAFEYRGGYGFSLGQVVIPKNSQGIVTAVADGLPAAVGGGFGLYLASQSLKLEGFPAPDLVTSIDTRSSFVVSEANDLYFGFMNVLDSRETGRIQNKYGAVSLRAVAAVDAGVVRVFVSREADWLDMAKVLPAEFSNPKDAVFWRDTAFNLGQSGTIFFADVISAVSLKDRILFLKIEGNDPPQFELPRLISGAYARPPFISAISLTGGTPQAVNYSNAQTENGLTTPFCHGTGDVVATFVNPTDLDNNAVTGTSLDLIEFRFEYYEQASGVTRIIPGSSALSSPYDADIAQTPVGSYLQGWSSLTKSLLLEMTTPLLADASHTLTLPGPLFPTTFGGKSVTRIRVKVLYKAKNHPGKSGSVFWIQKDC